MNKLWLSLFIVCGAAAVLFACNKELSVETNFNQQAAGSLWDSVGNCLGDTVHGTFYNGVVAGGDTAYVALNVNVTQTGAYNITTDMQNGFQLFDSGFFSTTGLTTIHLKPVGAAILNAPTTFTVSFDSTACSFTINVQDSTGTGLGGNTDTTGGDTVTTGTWKFATDSGQSFQGTFYIASIVKDSLIWGTGNKMLVLAGYTKASIDSAITLIMYLPNGVITPGTYSTQSVPPANSSVFAFNYTLNNGGSGYPIYQALPASSTGSNITITITGYDNTTHVVKGTFSGIAEYAELDDDNVTIGIKDGVFSATVTQ